MQKSSFFKLPTHRKKQRQLFLIGASALFAVFVFGGDYLASGSISEQYKNETYTSVEVGVATESPQSKEGGLAIPASCELGYEDFAGECDLADLIAENLLASGTLEEDQTVTFSGDITNIGPLGAGVSKARFCIDSAGGDGCLNLTSGINIGEPTVDFVVTDTFTVPAGVTEITVKAWGGGGGGGNRGGANGNGAGAGFIQGEITVTAGETLDILVGGGGDRGGNGGGGVGGGGAGGSSAGGGAGGGGGGGGRSEVSKSGTQLFVAAGGGGGGGGDGGNGGGSGGVGGGSTGTDGISAGGGGGGGGTQSAGGSGGSPDGTAGASLASGGGGTSDGAGGGGGGSGYFGGGGGGGGDGASGETGGGGGGGGSSFAASTATAISTASGSGTSAGNNTDEDYAGSAGAGGAGGNLALGSSNDTAGNPGRVVISWATGKVVYDTPAAVTSSVTVSATWKATAGDHTVFLCADALNPPPFPGAVSESNETNNCTSLTLPPIAPAAPECSDGIDNDGDGNTDFPKDLGCDSSSDDLEFTPPPTLLMDALPSKVFSGETTDVQWTVSNVTSCTVTGTNSDSWSSGPIGGTEETFTQTSSPITETTTFTLVCTDLEENLVGSTVMVTLRPQFEEF